MPRAKDKKSKRTRPVPVEDLTPPANPKGGLAAPFIPGAGVVSAAISGGSTKKT